MPGPTLLADRLQAYIEAHGPIPVARFMAEANAEYYATRDPFGTKGDFITAPEISQMFGELVGVCLADVWEGSGKPDAAFVELGPGRGTLADDALRAMAAAGLDPPVHFVETSPILRNAQRERVPQATWHDRARDLPRDRPLMIVANEFFDAMPIRQFVKTMMGWRELMIGYGPDGFTPVPGHEPQDSEVPAAIHFARTGSVYESGPAAASLARSLVRRIARQGGVMLIIDYGYDHRAAGDTLQAVHTHAYADPFAMPGRSDLTAHVDFGALEEAGDMRGITVHGPVAQGDWLIALGIDTRADALTRQTPTRGAEIAAAHARLTRREQMGTLFKVIGYSSRSWQIPAGFDGD
jgi:NADH dehydrogenase [ubiquinone] 1 alpha subcomplex assembly factor 7